MTMFLRTEPVPSVYPRLEVDLTSNDRRPGVILMSTQSAGLSSITVTAEEAHRLATC